MKLKFIEKIIVTSILFALFSCKSSSLNGKWVSLEDGYFSNVTLDICDNQFRITNLPSTLYMPDDDYKENIIFFDSDGIINKNDRDVFTAHGGMHYFRHTDRGQIAVSLIRKHYCARFAAFNPGGNGRAAAMSALHGIASKIVIGEHGTTYRRNTDDAVCNSQFIKGFPH